jgi:AraC-like DNA-binding protein
LAHALLDAAEAHGVARQRVQAAARCALGEREVGSGWIEFDSFARLIEAAVELTRDPALGLHWGERAPSSNFGLIASLALWSPSPRTALNALLNFQALFIRGLPVASFEARGPVARLRFELAPLQRTARRAWAEFSVVGITMLFRHLGGHAQAPIRSSFEHAQPMYVREYRRILGDHQVAFEADACFVDFDSAALDRSVPMYNPRLSEAVLHEADCALARLGCEPRESVRVREQLAAACPRVPNMDEVARKLGMSSRTLRRHLEQEGVAFPTLVADALRERALRLLGDPRIPVKEIAYSLGFATPSAFHRAFKRWTGTTPKEFREQHQR